MVVKSLRNGTDRPSLGQQLTFGSDFIEPIHSVKTLPTVATNGGRKQSGVRTPTKKVGALPKTFNNRVKLITAVGVDKFTEDVNAIFEKLEQEELEQKAGGKKDEQTNVSVFIVGLRQALELELEEMAIMLELSVQTTRLLELEEITPANLTAGECHSLQKGLGKLWELYRAAHREATPLSPTL